MKPVSKYVLLGVSIFLHTFIFVSLYFLSNSAAPKNISTTIELSESPEISLRQNPSRKSEYLQPLKKETTIRPKDSPNQQLPPETSTNNFETTNEKSPSDESANKAANSPLQIVNINEVTRSVKRTVEAKIKNIEGKIKLKLFVDEHGEIQKITPLNALGFGLDEVAIAAAHKLIFIPARVDSKNVSTEAIYTVTFSLQHQ